METHYLKLYENRNTEIRVANLKTNKNQSGTLYQVSSESLHLKLSQDQTEISQSKSKVS